MQDPTSAGDVHEARSQTQGAAGLAVLAVFSIVVLQTVSLTNTPFLWLKPGSHAWFVDGYLVLFSLAGSYSYRLWLQARNPIEYYKSLYRRLGSSLHAYAILLPILLLIAGAIVTGDLATTAFVKWFLGSLLFVPLWQAPFPGFVVGPLNPTMYVVPVAAGLLIVSPCLFILADRCSKSWRWSALSLFGFVVLIGLSESAWPQTSTLDPLSPAYVTCLLFFLVATFLMPEGPFVTPSLAEKRRMLSVVALAGYCLGRYWLHSSFSLAFLALFVPFAPPWFASLARLRPLALGILIWHLIVADFILYATVPSRFTTLVVFFFSAAFGCANWVFVERRALRLR